MTAKLKRTLRAAAFCAGLLLAGYFFLFHTSTGSGSTAAKEDPIEILLRLPAPAPPNPLVKTASYYNRQEKFFSKASPPKDDAPIEDLLDYWLRQSNSYQELRYLPEISDAARNRIMKEIGKKPSLLAGYLNVLKGDPKAGDFVKEIYDREGTGGAINKEDRRIIKEWLMYNSPYFSTDLSRKAAEIADSGEYVSGQTDLLALARVDFDRAKPIIDRLLGDSSLKVSRVAATWALYRHALDTNSSGDIETYRDALKAFVEDKNAMPGMRDLAMDALVTEKEWSGRDDWYFSLLGDETLAKLVVNGQINTGLTTLILNSPDGKYVEKMIELAGSSDPAIRGAAVRNLAAQLTDGDPAVIKALLPWLEDPKWVADVDDSRPRIVAKLSEIEVPESVLGLIKILDERQLATAPNYGVNVANTAARAASGAVNAAYPASNVLRLPDAIANRPANAVVPANTAPTVVFPLRSQAVAALSKQKDGRAVPALRRVLPEMSMGYERDLVISAIWECGGFSLGEQLDALDTAAKGVRTEMDNEGLPANMAANGPAIAANYAADGKHAPTPAEIRASLGRTLLQAPAIPDVLARGVVDRITVLDIKDRPMAAAYRRMILRWQNAAINLLLLRDLKRGVADADSMIRLLGQRKELREKQSTDIFDIRTGTQTALGISGCLLEDAADYSSIIENGSVEAKTAMLACARLLRLPLQVAKVAENLKSTNTLLQTAAERYLESEDSPEARTTVLARHPNEARILGAQGAFNVEGAPESYNDYLFAIYQSLGDNALYNGWSGAGNDSRINAVEKELQAEVKKTDDLVGIYSYDGNYIRIYKDNRVIFSWDEDDSRYRERPLTAEEFDAIKGYLAHHEVDKLPPFLSCGGAYCNAKELLMLSRVGGRRVYMTETDGDYGNGGEFDFFVGLEKYFAGLKKAPAKLKYRLSREIPGLEIVLAADDLNAVAVWKDGADFRVAASEKAVRDKVRKDIDGDETDENAPAEDYSEESEAKKAEQREKRRFEGYAWYKIEGGEVAGVTSQPAQFDYLPIHDGIAVQTDGEQWKARLPEFEVRAADTGLFKFVRGRLTKLRDGSYSDPVITPNGRWVFVSKQDDRTGQGIFRVDLTTNKESKIEIEAYGDNYPLAYIASINKVLVIRNDYRYYRSEDDDTALNDADPDNLLLVDPATGVATPAPGEFRPAAQQTYRPLQKTSKPNEYWAAVIDEEKGMTDVGIYETKTFGFKPVLKVPKIRFNSMDMWVDEPGKKVYFVYRGHLLSLPLP